MADSAKRKRKANGAAIDGKRTKALETDEEEQITTTTSSSSSSMTIEDEVEEFFAILRRFHTAVRHYKKEEKSKDTKFKQKDLKFDHQIKAAAGMEEETVGGVNNNQGKREKAASIDEENFVLDLNLVPNTDTNH